MTDRPRIVVSRRVRAALQAAADAVTDRAPIDGRKGLCEALECASVRELIVCRAVAALADTGLLVMVARGRVGVDRMRNERKKERGDR